MKECSDLNAHMEHSVDSLEENLTSKINAETECKHAPTHLLKSMQRIKLTCKLLKCLSKQSSTFLKGKNFQTLKIIIFTIPII